MSNPRYLQLSSAFRDRRLYPNPASFTVQIAQYGGPTDGLNSKTPSTLAMPCYNFRGATGTFGPYTFGDGNIYGPGTSELPNLNGTSTFAANTASNQNGYYNGSILEDDTTGETSIIVSYTGGDLKQCVLENSFGTTWAPGNDFKVVNPSSMTTLNPQVVINGGEASNQFYTRYLLEDFDLDPNTYTTFAERFKTITSYSAITKIAVLESAFPAANWTSEDRYRIRAELPMVMGFGNEDGAAQYNVGQNGPTGTGPENGQNGGVNTVSIDRNRQGSGFTPNRLYVDGVTISGGGGSGVEILVERVDGSGRVMSVRVIIPGQGYNAGGQLVLTPTTGEPCTLFITDVGQTVDISRAAFSGNLVGNINTGEDSYRGNILYVRSKGPELNDLNAGSNGSDPETTAGSGYYRQLPVKLTKSPVNISNKGNGYENIPYTSDTTGCVIIKGNKYAVQTEFPREDGGSGPTDNSCILITTNFSTPVTGGVASTDQTSVSWEIQRFVTDTSVDLNYTGSIVSQQNSSCYQVRLQNVVLPNTVLNSDYGGLAAFHPYIYVQLTNGTDSSGRQVGVLYSNNPNAVTATFKASLDDIPTPIISKFIKVDGDNSTQTIKFKPNDSLVFRVFFGNGETFTTLTADNAPPEYPHPLLQISALFQIERLS